MPKRRAPAKKAAISSRPAFGDFLALTTESVLQHSDQRVPGGEDVQQTCESLRRVVAVMRRYVQDPPRNVALFPAQKQPLSADWDRARTEVRRALLQASAWLSSPATMQPRSRSATHTNWLAHRLGRAALALTTGRDLLYTHFAQSPEGTWYPRSEWAEVLASPQAFRAMLIEMAAIARVIAPEGTRVAMTPGWRGSPLAREKLTKACQWLWILNASVQEANQTDPVPEAHTGLLRGMTSSRLPGRSQPRAGAEVPDLCATATAAAERARRAAWRSGSEAAWSPALTITSLRLAAGSAVVISHNNHTLLTSLADTVTEPTETAQRQLLLTAAAGAAKARQSWLQVARALEGFTTDTRSHLGPAATETSDIALWTGRVAYTDPHWTPSHGTNAPVRTGPDLAPNRSTMREVVAAVHHATYTLGFLAAANQRQIQTANRARRILVPVTSIPDTFDLRVPFTAAPAERVQSLLDVYRSAEHASGLATDAIANAAVHVGTSSGLLAAAADMTDPDAERQQRPRPSWRQQLAAIHHPEAGPTERILRDLDVTDSALLAHAAELDRTSARLLVHASEQLDSSSGSHLVDDLAAGAGTAFLLGQALSTGNRSVATVAEPSSACREGAEAEH